ncbi:Asp/Glu racemase [Rhodobacterales bacterium HKCCE4037]|nr:Asp/Glu racemase [Rhodobacterales bacterium HKCCE4037]
MNALPYEVNAEMPPQLGVVVLQSDETIERDLRHLLPAGAELLVTRIPSGDTVTPETLAAMAGDLSGAVSLFPGAARFAVVGYGCTSGTAEIGIEQVDALVRSACHTQAVTQPVSALVSACAALSVGKLGLVSPYIAPVSERLRGVLASSGLRIAAFASFEEEDEARVVRISQASVRVAAVAVADQGPCEALFLSCTNLRTLDVVDEIEDATGLPCLSSNLVLAWDMMRRAGLRPPASAPGALMRILR